MSNQNESSLYKEQKKIRPKIEDVFSNELSGEKLNSALDFIAYLRANKMSPVWTSANSWKCSHKNQGVCYVRTYGTADNHTSSVGSWSVTLYGDYIDQYNDFVIKGNYQDIVWNTRALKKCHRCHPEKCAPEGGEETFTGFAMTFFGKEFRNVCRNGDTSFSDPDERIIDYIKGAIDILRQKIEENKI